MITDLDKKGKEIFELWKGREEVELAFDALKNELDLKVMKIVEKDGREYFAKIPKKSERILALFQI